MVVMQGVRYIEVLHFLRGSAHMRRVHLKVPASSYVMLCYLLETTVFLQSFPSEIKALIQVSHFVHSLVLEELAVPQEASRG